MSRNTRHIMMKIIGAKWASKVNILIIKCKCGHEFEHQADRWGVKCPNCMRQEHLQRMRKIEQWEQVT